MNNDDDDDDDNDGDDDNERVDRLLLRSKAVLVVPIVLMEDTAAVLLRPWGTLNEKDDTAISEYCTEERAAAAHRSDHFFSLNDSMMTD